MTINEFIVLVDQGWRQQRGLTPAHPPIEQINLPSHLYNDLRNSLGVTGWGGFLYMGSKIEEDLSLNKNEIEFLYESKINDYQDIDFTFFENLPFATARVAICSKPVFGSAKLSGTNQNPSYTAPKSGNYIWSGNMVPVPLVYGQSITFAIDDPLPTEAPKQPGCQHQWKKYQGFHLESFDYCTICDTKR